MFSSRWLMLLVLTMVGALVIAAQAWAADSACAPLAQSEPTGPIVSQCVV